jgi:hypothetical protein
LVSGIADSPCFSFILGSYSNYLLVYRDIQLVWTAKTSFAPIFIGVTQFQDTPGLIVTLSDDGWLQVSFLGTEPPEHSLFTPETKELNYE